MTDNARAGVDSAAYHDMLSMFRMAAGSHTHPLKRMLQRIVLCDLDGTLCDTTHRDHILESKPVDWPKYYSQIPGDALIEPTIAILWEELRTNLRGANCRILVWCTGRPATEMGRTMDWLRRHQIDKMLPESTFEGFNATRILMRPGGCFAPNAELKQAYCRMAATMCADVTLVEDNPVALGLAKEIPNVTVIPVANGNRVSIEEAGSHLHGDPRTHT